MAHRVEPRVLGTSTTNGTGNLTLAAGALTGHRSIQGSVAVNDTYWGYTEEVDANGNASGGYEEGLYTYSATDTVTRTVVSRSSNSNSPVNWAGGATKRHGITAWHPQVLALAPSANQNDYAPADLIRAGALRLGITATLKLTGLAATFDGHQVTISNTSTDFLLWLEHQNTASLAANRFDLPNGFPFFLMPGDRITLAYSAISSKWQAIGASSNISIMGLTEFTDFASGTVGPFTSTVSGTGAATAVSTYLVNTTERPMGVSQLTSGTTATGRATIGHAGTDSIVPSLGCMLSVARVAQQQANASAEQYQLLSGFIDSSGGATTDGVAWNLRWNGTAQEWSQDRFSNATRTGSVTGSPTPDNNYIWLVVFVNAAGTRADFIYSTDSVAFSVASSPTTGLPAAGRNMAWSALSIIKSAGTTARLAAIDLAGYRVDYVRG